MTDILDRLNLKLHDVSTNVPLAQYTTFKIGGPAQYFFMAKNDQNVIDAVLLAKELAVPYFLLGSGSNILVSDQGFAGLVIKMENRNVTIDNNIVTAEAGAKLQKVVRQAISSSLTGMEFLIGIPGTIGGAISGNVGTHSQWIQHIIKKVKIVNGSGEVEIVPKSKCDFSYRYSRFKHTENEIVLSGEFELDIASQKEIQENVSNHIDKKSLQPASEACAGSIFSNPPNEKSWQVIDKVGLRGKQIGGARVSEKHSNFIVNIGNATAEDVVVLISLIKQQVRDQLGIQLREEIKYIGFDDR